MLQTTNLSEHSGGSSNGSTPTTPHALLPNQNNTSTWPNLQETLQFERAASAILNERPHTISSGNVSYGSFNLFPLTNVMRV